MFRVAAPQGGGCAVVYGRCWHTVDVRNLLGGMRFQGVHSVFELRQVFAQVHFFCSGPQQTEKWKTGRLICVSDRRKPFERQSKFVSIQKLIKLLQVSFIRCDNFRRE